MASIPNLAPWQWLSVTLLALAAAHLGLSLWVPVPTIFPDELIYTELARNVAQGHGLIFRGEPTSLPTVLFPLLLAPLHLVGDPALAYRLSQGLNAVLMAATAVPIFLLARLLLPAGAAAAVAGLCALLPYTIYSHTVMNEGLFLLLTMSVAYAGLRAILSGDRRWMLALGALLGLAFFTKPQGALLGPVVAGAFLAVELFRRPEPGFWRRLWAFWPAVAVLVGFVALHLARMAWMAPEGQLFSPATYLGYYARDAAGFQAFEAANFVRAAGAIGGAIALSVGWLPLALCAPFAAQALRRGSPAERAFLAFSALLALVLVGLAARHVAVTAPPQVLERYCIYVAPLALIGAAAAVRRGLAGAWPAAAVGGVALAGLSALFVEQAAFSYVDTPTYAAFYRPALSLGWPLTGALAAVGGAAFVLLLAWLGARRRWRLAVAALAVYAASLTGFSWYAQQTLSQLYARDLPFVAWVQAHAAPELPIAMVSDGLPYMPAMLTDVFSPQPIRMVYFEQPKAHWLEQKVSTAADGAVVELSALPDGSRILAHRSVPLALPALARRGEVVLYEKRGPVRLAKAIEQVDR